MAGVRRRHRRPRQPPQRQAHRPGAGGVEQAAGPQDRRIRGGQRRRHQLQRLHAAQGFYSGSLATDRPWLRATSITIASDPSRARRPRHLAVSASERQTWPCRGLSPRHRFPGPASRWRCSTVTRDNPSPPASPASRPCSPASARSRMSHDGRPSRARPRARLRGGARPRVAGCSRRRCPSRSRCADRTLPAEGRSIACRRRQAALLAIYDQIATSVGEAA